MRIERVLVTGAGVGGLACATALAQLGVDVDVVEIQPHTEDIASSLTANALRALRSLGVLTHCLEAGFAHERNQFHDWHGNLVVDYPVRPRAGVPPFVALSRADLRRILTEAAETAGVKINLESNLRDLTDHGDRVEVALTDGRVLDYDLVVGFDGIHSVLRRHLFGSRCEPVHTGYSVWRMTTSRLPELTTASFFQGDGTRAGLTPINQRQMCFVLITPEPGIHPYDAQVLPELLRERLTGYSGPIGALRDGLTGAEDVTYTPLWDVPLPPSWYRGRIVVLGNAVHGYAPHTIHDMGMSLEDAVVLAEGVGEGLRLPNFMWRRFDRVQQARDLSRALLFTEIAASASKATESLRRTLPGQLSAVEDFLHREY